MNRSGPRRGQAYAHLVCIFCMSAGHEGRILLMPHLDKLNGVVAVQRSHNPVDAIAGIAINSFYSPFLQTMEKMIAYCHGKVERKRMPFGGVWIINGEPDSHR